MTNKLTCESLRVINYVLSARFDDNFLDSTVDLINFHKNLGIAQSTHSHELQLGFPNISRHCPTMGSIPSTVRISYPFPGDGPYHATEITDKLSIVKSDA